MSEMVINQHYVPKFVLSYFSNNKQVYEALVTENKLYKTSCNRSMSERLVYEHPLLEKNQLERFFHSIESDFAPALKSAIDSLDQNENLNEVREIIESYFHAIIVFYYRSGALLHEFSLDTRNKEDRVGYLVEKLTNSPYITHLSETIINHYTFAIIKSENNDFLLSDQYISTSALGIKSRFANISNRHMGLKDVLILIPLSSKYYVVYFHGKAPEYIKRECINALTEQQVRAINRIIINNSYIKCVGYSSETLREGLQSYTFKSPSSVYMEYTDGSVGGATLKKEIFFYENDEIIWRMLTEPSNFIKYRELGRNDMCGCNSGKKFKKCCFDNFSKVRSIFTTFSDKDISVKIKVHPSSVTELGVTEFFRRKTR